LADTDTFAELESLRGRGISIALEKRRNRSLEDSCGTLESFVSDPMWADLMAAIADGGVSLNDPEWQFS
jgi:hypothetical protein